MPAELKLVTDADPKIILIGLNRCATTTFSKLFDASGIPAAHWDDGFGQNMAKMMMTNIAMGRKPLDGFGKIRAFTDIAFVSADVMIDGSRLFRDLHAAYGDAYFILNTRNKADWLASRAGHAHGGYLNRCARANGMTHDEVIQGWSAMYDVHHAEVEAYFEGNDRFLRFDIDRDDPQTVADFLAPDFSVNLAHWGHYNQQAPNRASLG